MVDAARENENNLKEQIEQLRQETQNLSAMVEQGSSVAAAHVGNHSFFKAHLPSRANQRSRVQERKKERERERESVCVCVCVNF